jgi:hypothetical protein
MRGAIYPLPNTPLWRGDLLKKAQGRLYLYFSRYKVFVAMRVQVEVLWTVTPCGGATW